jgi:acetyl-CoA carboxylase biotin carboxyl carrier protein
VDLRELKKLVALMTENSISELEIEEQGQKIRIKRGSNGAADDFAAAGVRMVPAPRPVPPPVEEPRSEAFMSPKDATVTINSPMVGTFFHAPQPGAAPFVRVNETVGPDTVVCIIEAMKIMNEVKAEMNGEIVGILVEDGESVEYNQPLFVIKPAR